jgi:branched-chain amino acid transport system substrate-binding protein
MAGAIGLRPTGRTHLTRALRAAALAGCVGALLPAFAGCVGGGGDAKTATVAPGKALHVYSSLPLHGRSSLEAQALIDGIRLALRQAGGRAGEHQIEYTSLDDSTARAGRWDPGQTAQNAREVTQDPEAIAYIGDLDSAASAISIPILNQGYLPQVGPTSTYAGLTRSGPGAEQGEPQKYYPTGRRTFVRLVPPDPEQGAALAALMRSGGCRRVALASDQGMYGRALARLVAADARRRGLRVVSTEALDTARPGFAPYVRSVAGRRADCFAFTGETSAGAVRLVGQLAAALPEARLYGGDGTCGAAFTDPARRGISAAAGARYMCTVATPDLGAEPAGRAFLKAYRDRYGHPPRDPHAVYGYEAMRLVLDAIRGLGEQPVTKDTMLEALFGAHERATALGTYAFDRSGDTTLTGYSAYRVGPDGDPVFARSLPGVAR